MNKHDHLGFLLSNASIQGNIFVPRYYNPEISTRLGQLASSHELLALGALIQDGHLSVDTGHEIGKMAYGTGAIPFIRTSDISNWEIKTDPKQGVSEEIYREYAEAQDVKAGDLLFVRDGTYLIGSSCIVTAADAKMLYQSHILKFRVAKNSPIPSALLLALLSTPIVRRQIRAKQFTADIIDTIGNRYVELLLPVPRSTAAKEGDIIGRGNSEVVNLCVAAILAKQMRVYYAVIMLCRKGLGNEAVQILRSMFQTFYNLKALEIVDQKAEFARRWMLWCIANTGKQVDLVLKTRPDLDAISEDFRGKLAEDKKRIGNDGAWINFVKNGPTQLDLASLADHLDRHIPNGNFRASYDSFYCQASSGHGYDLADYAVPVGDGHIQVNLSPSKKGVDAALATAMCLLRDSLAVINFLLGLNKNPEIESLTKLIKSMAPEVIA